MYYKNPSEDGQVLYSDYKSLSATGRLMIKEAGIAARYFAWFAKKSQRRASQDGNQRNKAGKQWTVTKYDIFGRVLYTGIINREILQSEKNLIDTILVVESRGTANQLADTEYTCNYFVNEIVPLTVNYYDDYQFSNATGQLAYQEKEGYSKRYASAKGLLTGTRTYRLDGSGQYTAEVFYYDYRGSVVQTRSTNHLGGYDIVYHDLDFTGKPNKTLKEHNIEGQSVIPELYTYTYDHAGRLTQTKYKLKDQEIILAANTYDELGRLIGKTRHNGQDNEEYGYNIRNWTTRIKSGDFEQKLYYNTNLPLNATACYNGNIAYTTWTYGNSLRGYQYNYDNLNRYTGGYAYMDGELMVDYEYSEWFNYDKMGNITHLTRYTFDDTIDQLHFDYSGNGNQVTNITDSRPSRNQYSMKEYQDKANEPVEFFYDKNGNMVTDLDRDIVTIKYNLLNLPDTIQFRNGNQIVNNYNAAGVKLSDEYYTLLYGIQIPLAAGDVLKIKGNYGFDEVDLVNKHYVDNFTYNWHVMSTSPGRLDISKIYNPEGYKPYNWSNLCYYRKDHLGSIREVWHPTYGTVQRTQYYPSGLPWSEGYNANLQQRKYNGKEWIEAHGLDEYDSQARMYYPAIKRTTTMDELCEEFYHISPYAWSENNPVNNVDLDGRFSTRFGAFLYRLFNGGEIHWSNDKGEYFVSKRVEHKDENPGVTYERVFNFNSENRAGETINKIDKASDFIIDFTLAAYDFTKNYSDMKSANWLESDKYFHSKANFEASRRGPGGEFFSIHFSNLREITDQRIKGDSKKDSEDDQEANSYGRSKGKDYRKKRGKVNYKEAIPEYRPKSLPDKY